MLVSPGRPINKIKFKTVFVKGNISTVSFSLKVGLKRFEEGKGFFPTFYFCSSDAPKILGKEACDQVIL